MTIREAVDAFGKAAYALGVASARGGPTYPLRQQEHDEALARLHEVLQRDCPHTVTREGNS